MRLSEEKTSGKKSAPADATKINARLPGDHNVPLTKRESAAVSNSRETGLGHWEHPLLGKEVVDTATGRTGILRAICPDPDECPARPDTKSWPGESPLRAWLSPVGGGREWTTAPDAIEATG